MPIPVQLVNAARLRRGQVDGRAVLIKLFVPVARGVSLGFELPPLAQVGRVPGILKVGLHVVRVVLVIIRVRRAIRQQRCVVQQVVISELRNLRPRGIRRIRRIVPDIDHTAIQGQTRPVGKPVLKLAITGVALLVVIRLIPVRCHPVDVEQDGIPLFGAKQAGLDIERDQLCVERAVRNRAANIGVGLQFRRLHIDGSAEVCGAEIRGLARATVEVRRTDPLPGKAGPGMMRRTVGVFERNAVERKCVLAVGETAEEGLTLPEADSVRIEAERARRLLDNLGEIRHRGHEIRDHRTADLRLGGSRVERIAGRSRFHRHRYRFLNRDRLRNGVHVKRDRDIFRSASGNRDSATGV